jgi:PhnB protein
MSVLNPYLHFNGNCEEAFDFYRSAFGGDFHAKSRYKDMPSPKPLSAQEGEKIVHVALPIGKEARLMGSDWPPGEQRMTAGNNFSICVNTGSEQETDKLFKDLSSGGNVKMPPQKAPWNAYFGMLVDRFGVHWMLNYEYSRK